MAPVRCSNPSCDRTFATEGGMRSHLRQAKSCSWYWAYLKAPEGAPVPDIQEEDGDATEMDAVDTGMADIPHGQDSDDEGDADADDDEPAEVFQELMEEQNIFHFVDLEDVNVDLPGIGQAGPGPSTADNRRRAEMLGSKRRILADEDDTRVHVEHATAGKVIRMDPTLHSRWAAIFGHKADAGSEDIVMDGSGTKDVNLYAPFASELDWKVAQWMVKDGIGHKSFNRLLAIPGVRDFSFILP